MWTVRAMSGLLKFASTDETKAREYHKLEGGSLGYEDSLDIPRYLNIRV